MNITMCDICGVEIDANNEPQHWCYKDDERRPRWPVFFGEALSGCDLTDKDTCSDCFRSLGVMVAELRIVKSEGRDERTQG